MKVGVVTELKNNENRVGLTPDGAARLVEQGHSVVVERGAGAGCGFEDAHYADAGATPGDVDEAWDSALVVKVKEPVEAEFDKLRGQILFCYLHLAGQDRALTEALLRGGTTAVAYETVEDEAGGFPLLAPMSAVAGSIAPLMGVQYLANFNGGRGTLLCEVLGERHGRVLVVGDGTVGWHAAKVSAAMGARVQVLGLRLDRAREFEALGPNVEYLESTPERVAALAPEADLLVGAVLVGGARAPRVVSEATVARMRSGSVIVDVSIDQGGCVETSRPTSHSAPVFVAHGVIHYCVTNMPGAYPRTSTIELTRATLPYIVRIARNGIDAVRGDPLFVKGISTFAGFVTARAVAEALGMSERHRALEDISC